jgi:hypothetical protein
MYNPPGNAVDILDNILSSNELPQVPSERSTEPWDWKCSDEMRKVLESMGVYESLRDQLEVIDRSESKRDIELARTKLDALGKAMNIMKNATTVHKDSGTEDNEEGVSRITIDMSIREDSK